jgi:hypothetical protein
MTFSASEIGWSLPHKPTNVPGNSITTPGSDFVAGAVPHRQAKMVTAASATITTPRQMGIEPLSADATEVIGACMVVDLHRVHRLGKP